MCVNIEDGVKYNRMIHGYDLVLFNGLISDAFLV